MDFTEITDQTMIAGSGHGRCTVFLNDQRSGCFERSRQRRTSVHGRVDPSTGRAEIYKAAGRLRKRIGRRSMTHGMTGQQSIVRFVCLLLFVSEFW